MPEAPVRTCVGCREAVPATDLLCLIAPAGTVRLARRGRGQAEDEAGKRGRGAWVHPRCLAVALSRGALGRAFRRSVEISDPVRAISESPIPERIPRVGGPPTCREIDDDGKRL